MRFPGVEFGFENSHGANPQPTAPGVASIPHCNARATSPADIVALYKQLRAAPSHSDEFELLDAAWNRVCSENPDGVAIALRMEAFTA